MVTVVSGFLHRLMLFEPDDEADDDLEVEETVGEVPRKLRDLEYLLYSKLWVLLKSCCCLKFLSI